MTYIVRLPCRYNTMMGIRTPFTCFPFKPARHFCFRICFRKTTAYAQRAKRPSSPVVIDKFPDANPWPHLNNVMHHGVRRILTATHVTRLRTQPPSSLFIYSRPARLSGAASEFLSEKAQLGSFAGLKNQLCPSAIPVVYILLCPTRGRALYACLALYYK